MPRMVRSFFPLVFSVILAACGGTEPRRAELVGTIRPWARLLKQIAGGRFTVDTFTPAGASPHTWSPAPADMKKLEKAKLVLANGLGLEEGLTAKLKGMGDRVLFAGEVPGLPVAVGHDNHGDDPHHHDAANPHIWLDADVLVRVAQAARDRLTALDPPGRPVFKKYTDILIGAIRKADTRIKEERKAYAAARIITFHDAFAWFRRRYGIEQVAVVAASPGRQPSSQELVRIGALVRVNPVRAIFIEPQLDPKAAHVLAREFGLAVAVLDPLGVDAADPAGLLSGIWDALVPHFEKK